MTFTQFRNTQNQLFYQENKKMYIFYLLSLVQESREPIELREKSVSRFSTDRSGWSSGTNNLIDKNSCNNCEE